jgi:hypothetical protein
MDIKAVKENLNHKVKLKGRDGEYLFSGYILRKVKDTFIHQAELQDLQCGHCIVIAKLEDVEKAKTEK